MASKYGNPGEMSGEDLAKAIADARSEGAELAKVEDADITDDQLDELSSIAEFITQANQVQAEQEAAAAERSARIAELRGAVAEPEGDNEAEEETDSESTPTEEAEAASESVEAEVPQAAAADTQTASTEGVTTASREEEEEEVIVPLPEGDMPVAPVIAEEVIPAEPEDEEEKEKAAVSQNKASLADAAKNSTQTAEVPEDLPQSNFSLTASANVTGVVAGTQYDNLVASAEVIRNSIAALPTSGRGRTRQPALTLRQKREELRTQGATAANDTEMLMRASSEAQLPGGSLVAAGGWAAPSEQTLDFCDIETAENLIDLPSITVTRGGVNYTKGPTFADVLESNVGFWDMTEAEAEAGSVQKTAIRPGIPDFTDIRLDAVGAMMEAGLLTREGWPELIERYEKLTLLAHEVKKHHKVLRHIEAFTGTPRQLSNGYGNALDILHILDVAVTGERQRYSLSDNQTLEALLPYWVKTVIRIDLANRNGVDLLNVADAQIASWFAARGVRVQWLNHWQDIDLGTGTNGFAVALPETVRAIFYPAGTYVKGENEVLTLDTVYDSTNLKRNDYVHLFTEQGVLVANPCFDGKHAEFPLLATGRTGAADLVRAFGREAAVTP